MALYVMADLHLSLSTDKPMDVFGARWEHHDEKISENWNATIDSTSTTVLVGDHSWGMREQEALPDLRFIESLPGRKILFQGNHDLWWQTAKKLRGLVVSEHLDSLSFVKSGSLLYKDDETGKQVVICGTRGWTTPDDSNQTAHDNEVYAHEVLRLKNALEEAKKLTAQAKCSGDSNDNADNNVNHDANNDSNIEIIGFMHYPPFGNSGKANELTALFDEYGVKRVYYGHLHGLRPGTARTQIEGCNCDFTCVASDYLDFKPIKIEL